MITTIIGISALEYWLNGTDKYFYLSPDLRSVPQKYEFHISNNKSENLSKEYRLSFPINFMAPKNRKAKKGEKYSTFYFINGLPYKSFVKLNDRGDSDDEVYVACPELCFLQAAHIFPFYLTVKIGCMLCAMYIRDDDAAIGQRNIQPLTTVNKIKKYLDKVDKVQGIQMARRAIKYVSDNCNSPMEVNIATMGKLPISKGGYALGNFEMNGVIKLKQEEEDFLGRKTCMCDILWKKEKVVVEYESNMVHLDKEQHAYDKRRSTAIVNSGYKIINVTAKDVGILSRTDEIFWIIRRTLGIRSLHNRFKNFDDIRFDVYREVFKKNIFNIFEQYNQKQNKTI